ncbi:hypothetical protein GKQ38_00650 [Candidatus Nanohaloarchaea archaeon]|nr:hypothetical protein GKQ38_00650 [Candidatus Nanohaloarchaea archaeon]
MKHLPPTLREDQRYLKYRVHSEKDIEFSEVVEAIWEACLNFMGEKGASNADPWIMKNLYSYSDQVGVVKVNSQSVTDFRAALAFVDSFGSEKGFLTVEQVSGTVKSLEGVEN